MPPNATDELLERTAAELRLRGYSPKTRKVYVGHVRRFLKASALGRRGAGTDDMPGRPGDETARRGDAPNRPAPVTSRSTDVAPGAEARKFLLHLLEEKGASHSYVNQAVSALKFFFEHVHEEELPDLDLPRPKVERSLPVILGREEVARLLGSIRNRKHRAILMLVYSSGLRVGEVVRLRVGDVDPERMALHVRRGKGRKDRYVMLSEIALEALRDYRWRGRATDWLFPGAKPGRHLTERSVQKVFHKARKRAGIRKKVSVHSLRHAFATHLLESGTDIRFIQKLLGHRSTKTTEIYTRVTRRSLDAIQSPLDQLWEAEGRKDGSDGDGRRSQGERVERVERVEGRRNRGTAEGERSVKGEGPGAPRWWRDGGQEGS